MVPRDPAPNSTPRPTGVPAAISESPSKATSDKAPSDRRTFVSKVSAAVIGGLITIAAPIAGLLPILDPLRRRGDTRGMVRVTSFAALPESGEPR